MDSIISIVLCAYGPAILFVIITIVVIALNNRSEKYSPKDTKHIQGHLHYKNKLPNGYTRQDYYNHGYTDTDIEFWGLDQPGAPESKVAGFIVADMMDGDFDGDIDFPF